MSCASNKQLLGTSLGERTEPHTNEYIEIDIPVRACIYICINVQKNAWHPPEGKCSLLNSGQ